MQNRHTGISNMEAGARVRARSGEVHPAIAVGMWDVVCRDRHGRVKFIEEFQNLIVNAGLDYLLDIGLSGGTQITTWYVGLTDGSPTVAAGDTLASHAGWTEVTNYDEANRVTWTDGGVSGQSVDNSASTATFTISAGGATVGGAFLASANSGTSGTLFAAGAFTGGNRTLSESDTLDVTATFSLSSS